MSDEERRARERRASLSPRDAQVGLARAADLARVGDRWGEHLELSRLARQGSEEPRRILATRRAVAPITDAPRVRTFTIEGSWHLLGVAAGRLVLAALDDRDDVQGVHAFDLQGRLVWKCDATAADLDDEWIVIASDAAISVRDVSSGSVLARETLAEPVGSVSLAGNRIVAARDGDRAILLDAGAPARVLASVDLLPGDEVVQTHDALIIADGARARALDLDTFEEHWSTELGASWLLGADEHAIVCATPTREEELADFGVPSCALDPRTGAILWRAELANARSDGLFAATRAREIICSDALVLARDRARALVARRHDGTVLWRRAERNLLVWAVGEGQVLVVHEPTPRASSELVVLAAETGDEQCFATLFLDSRGDPLSDGEGPGVHVVPIDGGALVAFETWARTTIAVAETTPPTPA